MEQHRIMSVCVITGKSAWLESRVCYAKGFNNFPSGYPELSKVSKQPLHGKIHVLENLLWY